MKKPCDGCSINIEQAIVFDEVICYQTCQKWLEWKSHTCPNEDCEFN